MRPSPRHVTLIGLGAGSPDHLTLEAVAAIRAAEAFFLLEKGGAGKDALTGLRRAILARTRPEGGYRIVAAPSPERGVGPATKTGYAAGVERWRRGRGAAIGAMIERELAPGGRGAFLVWGDPCLYDGMIQTLRELNAEGAGIDFGVVPGVSSVQALTAAHRIPLNRIGETISIATARILERTPPEQVANMVVMLDGRAAFRAMLGQGLDIYWGAYLGTPDALTVSGPLDEKADEIAETIEAARARHGWIMDVYLLRRP